MSRLKIAVSYLAALPRSKRARSSAKNVAYSVADYISQPIGMLLTTPFLVRRMGLSQFGVWMVANAAVGGGGLLAAGFGDAAVKYVSMFRGRKDWVGLTNVVRGVIAINWLLSGLVGGIVWIVSRYVTLHMLKVEPELTDACIRALRIGSAILVVRSIESVFVSILRAFEEYKPAVQIAVISRAATLLAVVILVASGKGVVAIMGATLLIACCAVLCQGVAVQVHVGALPLLPSFKRSALSGVVRFGSFSWLQALSGVVFAQADKLILGSLLGTSAVAYYSICMQAAQPVHGLVGAALHFLFPHLSARYSAAPGRTLTPVLLIAGMLNLALVIVLCLPIVLFSRSILSLWLGPAFAHQAWAVLSLVAVGFGFLGLNVTGHYTLLALGQVKYVAYLNLAAGAVMLLTIAVLIRPFGVFGAAVGRLTYGPITWIMYFKVRQLMMSGGLVKDRSPAVALPAKEIELPETLISN